MNLLRGAALAALLLAGPVQRTAAQAAPADWQVRLVLDPERHRLRRVRAVLVREPGGALESPVLGADLLHSLRAGGWTSEWPGLEAGLALPTVRESTGEWTAFVDTRDHRVGTIRLPAFLPLVPDSIPIAARGITWVVRHDSAGRPAWAVGIARSLPAGLRWSAYGRAHAADDAPRDLDQAIALIPPALVRQARREQGEARSWQPRAALLDAAGSIRYNHVEGASIELPLRVPLTPMVRADAWARFSTSSYAATGGAGISVDRWPARWGGELRVSLEDANLWQPALGPGNSLSAFLYGQDGGHYYTTTGAVAWAERAHAMATWRLELFAERHRTALPRTDHALFPRPDTSRDAALDAESGEFHGVRAMVERQWGLTLDPGVVVGRVWSSANGGRREWVELGATVDIARSRGRWAVAGRVGAGGIVGHAPIQREYHLGGLTSVRGFRPAAAQGPAMALGRVEAGYGAPALRIVVFGDIGWAGEADALRRIGSAGIGISLAEGVVRVDLARALLGGTGFKLHIGGNGLL